MLTPTMVALILGVAVKPDYPTETTIVSFFAANKNKDNT